MRKPGPPSNMSLSQLLKRVAPFGMGDLVGNAYLDFFRMIFCFEKVTMFLQVAARRSGYSQTYDTYRASGNNMICESASAYSSFRLRVKQMQETIRPSSNRCK